MTVTLFHELDEAPSPPSTRLPNDLNNASSSYQHQHPHPYPATTASAIGVEDLGGMSGGIEDGAAAVPVSCAPGMGEAGRGGEGTTLGR